MSSRRAGTVWRGLALLATAALVVCSAPYAAAAPVAPQTYTGPSFSPDFPSPPTETDNQSKLWFHAGAWWALLLEPSGRTVRVFELMPDHSWRPTSAVVNPDAGDVGDALHDGDATHVVTRRFDGTLTYVRVTFDPTTRDYRADQPLVVPTRGAAVPVTIAKDSTGRLWIGFATAARVVVTYSDDGGVTWARSIILASKDVAETSESAALVAFDDRIGILWSDQTTGSFEFASHRDGDDPAVWSYERALTGPAQADDHINLKRVRGEPSDLLVAAVKTSRGDEAEPVDSLLIEVLVRTPDGVWTTAPVSTIADGLDDPVLQVDEATRTVHVIAAHDGSIVSKRAPLDDLRFPPGVGDLLVLGVTGGQRGGGGLVNPTVAKDPVGPRSGLVVLATDRLNRIYRHSEVPLPSPTPVVDPSDTIPPTSPGQLQGRAGSSDTVHLSWAPANDGERWFPANDGVPVQGYVVLRDGAEIATVTSTSFQDSLGDADAVTGGSSVGYQVLAVDTVGNRSEPARVAVDLPRAATGDTSTMIGAGLLALAALAGCYALRRRLVTHATARSLAAPRVELAPEGSRRELSSR